MTNYNRFFRQLRNGEQLKLLTAAIACLFVLCHPGPSSHAEEFDARLGFTASIFLNQNENDILAAMKVWLQTLSRERSINVNPDIVTYPTLTTAIKAVRENKVDALTLLLNEYAQVPKELVTGPFFRNKSTINEFVLLSKNSAIFPDIKELKGAKIAIHYSYYSNLAMRWLEAEMSAVGLGRIAQVTSEIIHSDKLSSAVLSVFFGKSDFCLVNKSGFESMVELNPQVGKRLMVVAKSSPIVTALFCFRSSFSDKFKTILYSEVLSLHKTVAGMQVLNMFKSEKMVEVSDEELNQSLSLLRKWRRDETAISHSPGRKKESGNEAS